ncbi:hypothetical protein KM043_002635 [Ampulex compressa]|nr:hypothetical protein KM043_002635 [Ampulex compressa]
MQGKKKKETGGGRGRRWRGEEAPAYLGGYGRERGGRRDRKVRGGEIPCERTGGKGDVRIAAAPMGGKKRRQREKEIEEDREHEGTRKRDGLLHGPPEHREQSGGSTEGPGVSVKGPRSKSRIVGVFVSSRGASNPRRSVIAGDSLNMQRHSPTRDPSPDSLATRRRNEPESRYGATRRA